MACLRPSNKSIVIAHSVSIIIAVILFKIFMMIEVLKNILMSMYSFILSKTSHRFVIGYVLIDMVWWSSIAIKALDFHAKNQPPR